MDQSSRQAARTLSTRHGSGICSRKESRSCAISRCSSLPESSGTLLRMAFIASLSARKRPSEAGRTPVSASNRSAGADLKRSSVTSPSPFPQAPALPRTLPLADASCKKSTGRLHESHRCFACSALFAVLLLNQRFLNSRPRSPGRTEPAPRCANSRCADGRSSPSPPRSPEGRPRR